MMVSTYLLERLTGNPFLRRTADAAFTSYAHRRVRKLDAQNLCTTQTATLISLVRQAQGTRFGRDHDFARIRTVADFQQRVPLRDYDAFWKDYWQTAFPGLTDCTWPGTVPYLALSSGTTTGTTKYIPVSHAMLASNRLAALTSLSWLRAAFPDNYLFTGRMFFLGGSTDLQEPQIAHGARKKLPVSVLAGDLSGIAAREVPVLLRPYFFPPLQVALVRDWEQKLDLLAEQSRHLPITLVSGVPSWLLVLFERMLQLTGRRTLIDVWPSLQVIVHGGTSFEPYRGLFRRVVGSEAVQYLETYPASEGFIAAEDPRFQKLRLIPDHQIFFEFVPVAELGQSNPTRHVAAEVVPGVQYAVLVTTCAGLWSYVLGDTVSFESRDPPLLRFTGRTGYGLSAFGEHLISEEIETAVARAAEATAAAVVDFHVGPVFPDTPGVPGRHRYLVEFAEEPNDLAAFARNLDEALSRANEDYAAHRAGDLTMLTPEICPVRRGGFAEWMRRRGKLGGQHKLPRMDNSGRLTTELSEHFLAAPGLIP
jgi:hypothetical protein